MSLLISKAAALKKSTLLDDIKARITLNQKFKIVFYGDSTTSTEWVHPNWREVMEYVIKMELEDFEESENGSTQWNYSWWNLNFVNSGLNGAETKDFIERLERDVFAHFPDMVIFIGGGNDVDKISEAKHAENVKFLLKLMTNKIRHVYMASDIYTVNSYHNKRYEEYFKAIKPLFPFKDAPLIDLYGTFKELPLHEFYTYQVEKEEEKFLTDESYAGGTIDTYHPNRLGNAYVAKILLKEIFDIDFDPELYIADVLADRKYPRY
jgi:lysophospholipase L1-like esterase